MGASASASLLHAKFVDQLVAENRKDFASLYQINDDNNQWLGYSRQDDTNLQELTADEEKDLAGLVPQDIVVGGSTEKDSELKVGSVIVCECMDVTSLTDVVQTVDKLVEATLPCSDAAYQLNLGLVLSNNAIDDEACAAVAAPLLRRLQLLAIGGNRISTVSTITTTVDFTMKSREASAAAAGGVEGVEACDAAAESVPKLHTELLKDLCFLKVLDFSFSEGLILDRDCFQPCPLLERLVLEGCGVRSTLLAPTGGVGSAASEHDSGYESDLAELENELPGGVRDAVLVSLLRKESNSKLLAFRQECCVNSVFSGLWRLRELRLSDNAIETYSDLAGLCALPQLTQLWLSENPVMEQEPGRRFVRQSLLRSAALGTPLLRCLDGVEMEPKASGAGVDQQAVHAPQAVAIDSGGGVQITDDMDQEFSMGLRGEKDVTAVA